MTLTVNFIFSVLYFVYVASMGGSNCAVATCTARRSYNRGLSFHTIPRLGVNDLWRTQLIKKLDRVDLWFLSEIKKEDACLWICSRHYKKDCYKAGQRKLINGSIPTEWMPVLSVVTPAPPERLPRKRRDESSEPDAPAPTYLTLPDLRKDMRRLPPGWTLLDDKQDSVSVGMIENYCVKVCVIVDIDLSAKVKVFGMPVPHLNQNMESVGLSEYLSCLSALKLCEGVTDPQLQALSQPPQEHTVTKHFIHTTLLCPENKPYVKSCVRSSSCSLLSAQEVCIHCIQTRKELTKKKQRTEKAEQKPLHKFAPLHNASKKKLKLAILELRKREKIKQIQKQLEQDSVSVQPDIHTQLKDVLTVNKDLIQDELTQLFWEEQNKAFKAKGKGMRWHPMMLRLAILLHSKGKAVYKTLRETGLLKLPGESTLRDYTNYIHPKAGFNPEVVAEIKAAADKLKENERFIVLMHDEMTVKEDSVWDSRSGELVGFVNLHQWTEQLGTNNIASHVLVFFVVGVNSSLKYSMGYFGSRTATADEIYPLCWQAVGLLELTCKLKVIASTSDKASPNQRFYQLHGQAQQVCYKTLNFYAPTRHIYFFSDVPHLIKTIRNNLFRSSPHKTMLLWNNGKELLWAHIRRVYDEDRCRQLVRRHKLTNEQVNLTSHALMNVKLAAQVLSKSVGSILQGRGYEECHETARLILLVNRFFDCLNTRSCEEAARTRVDDLRPYTDKNDTRFQFLDSVLAYLAEWKQSVMNRPGNYTNAHRAKMFLTHQTYKGIVMTVSSFKEVAAYLLDNGVQFLLSNKFCQDPLESHFGRHRGLGQRSDNPNIYSFGYQENKMRQQRGLAMRLQPKGNVEKRKREDIPIEISDSPLKKLKRKE